MYVPSQEIERSGTYVLGASHLFFYFINQNTCTALLSMHVRTQTLEAYHGNMRQWLLHQVVCSRSRYGISVDTHLLYIDMLI